MTIRYTGVSFWHDYNRSGTLTFKVKMAGLSRYYRSVDPPINPTMQSAPGLFWFLTSSCNGSIEGGKWDPVLLEQDTLLQRLASTEFQNHSRYGDPA
jgi:hypothetical protein